jgi:putative ABC transport system permease protein
VAADTKMPRDEAGIDQWYLPMKQPAILFGTGAPGDLSRSPSGFITLRAAMDAASMVGTLRGTVAEIDPLLALQDVQPVTEAISTLEAPRRFNTDLITAFAAGALLLAITGIYAVMAFSVSQRTQEIAIRMTLGAQRGNIARLFLISGAKLAVLGCGLGVLGSLAASQLVGSFLFDVSAKDPWLYVACVGIMMAMAVLASTLPAARAAATEPIGALRSN